MALPEAAVAQREVILAADDNEQNLQLLEEYLWQWGYDVVIARDGREAVDLFPQHNPSLIILDVMMPVMDGYEACSLIKATPLGRRIPVVMLTALTGTEDKIRALDFGADDFLNKPINREELRARIRSLLRIRTLRRELDSSENIIVTLTSALENKDPRSGGHIHRVASYSAQMCERLGMNADDRETVIKGSLLHDVGVIGVPDAVLMKTEPLTEEEKRIWGEHTRMGASILSPMTTFAPFVSMVRSHHERWDGKGYPDGLAGDAIPLEAQIVAVANRYDEIRQEVPTASMLGALERLRAEGEGGAFDMDLVDALDLSLRNAPLHPPARPRALKRVSKRPRVLCVDESQLNRDLITVALQDVGFNVQHAGTGEQALEVIARGEADLVLLDQTASLIGGADALQMIRADGRFEFLPVIVLTAQKSNDLRQQAIVAGADDFLTYPLNRLELITRIRSLLRLHDYHSDLEESQNIICALALALEAKDPYTRGHSQRVGDLAHAFALHLGFESERASKIRTAGLLHDIGKIAVPEGLLNKPGPLSRDEFLRVIDHPVVGEEICRPLLTLNSVLKLIRHHHERYDGRGYPDGLSGDAIPFEVRLLSIVDAYDALTSHRAYRPAPLTHAAAIETLRRESDAGKWDPAMVDNFCGMLGNDSPDYDRIGMPVPMLRLDAVS